MSAPLEICPARLPLRPNSGQEGYGAFIGTAMLASFLQMGLSFVPKKYSAFPRDANSAVPTHSLHWHPPPPYPFRTTSRTPLLI